MMAVRSVGPMSRSLRSVSSTPSHTEQTDAAVSYTNSSPSVSSLADSQATAGTSLHCAAGGDIVLCAL